MEDSTVRPCPTSTHRARLGDSVLAPHGTLDPVRCPAGSNERLTILSPHNGESHERHACRGHETEMNHHRARESLIGAPDEGVSPLWCARFGAGARAAATGTSPVFARAILRNVTKCVSWLLSIARLPSQTRIKARSVRATRRRVLAEDANEHRCSRSHYQEDERRYPFARFERRARLQHFVPTGGICHTSAGWPKSRTAFQTLRLQRSQLRRICGPWSSFGSPRLGSCWCC